MSRPQSQDISIAPTTVAEEQTRQRVTRDFGLTAEGAACLRVDVYVGEVVDTNAISFGLETSSGLGIWTDTKSVEVPANDTAEVEAATYLQYAQSLAQSDYQLVDEYWLAEQFVASTSGTLASAVMQLSNPDATTGGVIVQLRADDEGEPGALIAESSEIDLADVTSSWVEYTVTFDDDAVIEAGTTYWRVFATTAGTDEVNIRCTNGGFDIVQFYTDDGGATWMEDTGSAAVTRFYMSDADAFASASHGLASGAAVVLANSGGSLPLPLTPNTIYYARVLDENNFYLYETSSLDSHLRITPAGAGTGTHTVAPVTCVSLLFNPDVAADLDYLPLGNTARAYITTGTDDTCQVLAARVVQNG